MLKVLSFLRRRPDFGLAAFSDYWRTIHKAHALTLVEAGYIRGYVQNHRLADADEDLPGLPLMADGAPELWVEDAGVLPRLVASPEYQHGAGPDEANFIAPPVLAAVARERVLVDGPSPAGAVKLILVACRDPQRESALFAARWLDGGAPLLMPGAAPLRLARQLAVGDGAAFDGAECSWWPSLAALHAAWAGRDPRALDGLAATASLRGLVVREEVVVPPPGARTDRAIDTSAHLGSPA